MNYAQQQHQHGGEAPTLMRTANSLWLLIGRLHSAFFFWTCILSKTFVKTGLGFQDKVGVSDRFMDRVGLVLGVRV